MGNKNYEKGVRKERRIKKELERAGWTVLRMAGSHGFADLVAIRSDGKIRFIQVKPDNFSKLATDRLMEEHKIFNNKKYNWTTSFEVI